MLRDTGEYFTAPLRWKDDDWFEFGTVVAGVVVAHSFDDNVRDHFADNSRSTRPGQDPHSTRDALPIAAMLAGTFGYAAMLGDRAGYREGWTMVESAGLTALSSYGLKLVAGRERPNETTQVDRWFHGGDSFPSLHTSVAFGVGTVLAESGNDRWRWLRRALGYGLAAGVAYQRNHDGVHWLSDTAAGAALGIATANFTMNRREHGIVAMRGALAVTPTDGGMLLSYTMPLR